MNTNLRSPREALVESGLNPSFQRIRILEHMLGRLDHPTVSMVHDSLIREMPMLAKATVYNTLNAFVEKGLAIALTITSEECRYDCRREAHHHFLCKRCGSILDIEIRCKYAGVGEVMGHRVEDIHGYFKGTCKTCLTEEERARARSKKILQHTISKKGG